MDSLSSLQLRYESMSDEMSNPILYSFRRCPYAMRARMSLLESDVEVELREVILRDRPEHMMAISPKGTVPVLLLPDGTVIEESLDIMLWSLDESWLVGDWKDLIDVNDGDFKHHLDRYKYNNRYENVLSSEEHREHAVSILKTYEERLSNQAYLCGDSITHTTTSSYKQLDTPLYTQHTATYTYILIQTT